MKSSMSREAGMGPGCRRCAASLRRADSNRPVALFRSACPLVGGWRRPGATKALLSLVQTERDRDPAWKILELLSSRLLTQECLLSADGTANAPGVSAFRGV